jgi:hypothetical protein
MTIPKEVKSLQPGDPIKHKNSSMSWCINAVISLKGNKSPEDKNWRVSYTGQDGKHISGSWLKSNCLPREVLTPQQQGLPEPDVNKYEKNDFGTPGLKYHQALYSWRGFNGLGQKYSNHHYDEKLAIKESDVEWFDLENVTEETNENVMNKGTLSGICQYSAGRKTNYILTNRLKPESTIMKAEIQEVFINGMLVDTFINDKNIKQMVPSDFLCNIGNAQEAINKLAKHETHSIFAVQETKRLKVFIDSLYVLLDKTHSEDATPKK